MCSSMIKGQAALEYMIIIAVLLAALLPLIYLANQHSATSSASTEARIAVDTIVATADSVSSLSPGSKTTARIFIPAGYAANESYISGKVVFIKVYLANGKELTYYKGAKSNLTGSMPSNPGYHLFSFTFQDTASVLIEVAAG